MIPRKSTFINSILGHIRKQGFSYRPITKEDRKLPNVVSGPKLAKKLQKKLKTFVDLHASCSIAVLYSFIILEIVRREDQVLLSF